MALTDAGGSTWKRDTRREKTNLGVVLAYYKPDTGDRIVAKRATASYPKRETLDYYVIIYNGQGFDQKFDTKTEAKKFLRDYIKGNDLGTSRWRDI